MDDAEELRSRFVDWVRDNAVAIRTADPGAPLDDLLPLAPMFGDARIASLGEATHGTREFFQLKHRLAMLLGAELGFRDFLMEADYAAAHAVHEYLADGTADAADVLAGMRFWTWNTAEVLALLRWLREQNAASQAGPWSFAGVDPQFPAANAALLREQIGGEPALAAARAALSTVVAAGAITAVLGDPAQGPALRDALDAVDAWCEKDLARHEASISVSVLRQGIAMAEVQHDIWAVRRHRDAGMAANTARLVDRPPGNRKAVLWAHNQHVGRDGFTGMFPSLGGELDRLRPGEQVVVGFAYGEGGFRAVAETESGEPISKGPVEHQVPPMAPQTLDGALHEVGLPVFAVDLRTLPADHPGARWLATKPRTRNNGSGWNPGWDGGRPVDPREQYDLLIYVDKTTAAVGNPTGPGARS